MQRKAALRISSAYRTVSTVIAGITPIYMKVQEKTAVFNKQMTKTESRELAMGKWQTRWNKEVNGAWTRRLIPNIKPWVLRRYGEHTFFRCNRWTKYRTCAENKIGKELRVENLIERMLENGHCWNSVGEMITSIMKTKVEDERESHKA